MKYQEMLRKVANRGRPPVAFLDELMAWAKEAPSEIFAPNQDPEDVYNRLAPVLGPWESALHRKAAMVELMRCLGGFESSWRWNEGVDKTNQRSQKKIECQETGIFQVSYDSLNLDVNKADSVDDLKQCVLKYCGTLDIRTFIDRMKSNHEFALEYAARLLRNSYLWDGPIKRGEINSSLSREAMQEAMALLSGAPLDKSSR